MNNTFEEAMGSFKLRSPEMQRILRRVAAERLVRQGFEEVGSSDVNGELANMFTEVNGDWDQIILAEVAGYSDNI